MLRRFGWEGVRASPARAPASLKDVDVKDVYARARYRVIAGAHARIGKDLRCRRKVPLVVRLYDVGINDLP